MTYLIISVAIILLIWIFGSFAIIRNIEKPVYTVLEKRLGYEIREYQTYIIAKTEITGTYTEALGQGFRIIADYIFGNNTTKTSITMTAPILESESGSEKIAMTAPVLTTTGVTKARSISFVLPSKYTLETLPVPNNPQITLMKIPTRIVAVLRFSWYATEQRVAIKTSHLEKYLNRDGMIILGPTQVAQYNPPFSMPMTRRNEIIIPIDFSK